MITTVIFDLDGVLSDTEKLHREAYRSALGGIGVDLTDRQYEEHWIRGGRGIADFVAGRGLAVDLDAVRLAKAKLYRELVLAGAEPMPGAVAVLDRLHGRKTLALATASYHESAHAVLDKLGIERYFACIATKADVTRTKPFPDVFLFVAASLSAAPAECVVVEDAEKGIVAAAAAGMRAIAVPNVYTRTNDFSRAARVLDSLDELTLDMLDNLDGHPCAEG